MEVLDPALWARIYVYNIYDCDETARRAAQFFSLYPSRTLDIPSAAVLITLQKWFVFTNRGERLRFYVMVMGETGARRK